MTPPWLSVVMPIYNGAATLQAALDGLPADPAAEGIEILAVVQASNDGSREMLAAAGVRILDFPEGTNWVETTNRGLAGASAPLVTMLHQDDLWRPGRAALLRGMATRHPEARLWVHASDYVDAAGRRIGRSGPPFGRQARLLPGSEALERLIVQNTVALPAAMFRRDDALAGGGMDPALWYTADWELWLRLSALGPVAWSPESLTAYRIHAGAQTVRRSDDLDGFRAQLAAPVARHAGALPATRRAGAVRLATVSNALNAGLAGAFHGDRRALRQALAAALRLGPGGLWRLLRDSRLPQRLLPRLRLRRA